MELISLRHMKGNTLFMYLRAVLCNFKISVYFDYVPVGGRVGGKGGWRKGGGC